MKLQNYTHHEVLPHLFLHLLAFYVSIDISPIIRNRGQSEVLISVHLPSIRPENIYLTLSNDTWIYLSTRAFTHTYFYISEANQENLNISILLQKPTTRFERYTWHALLPSIPSYLLMPLFIIHIFLGTKFYHNHLQSDWKGIRDMTFLPVGVFIYHSYLYWHMKKDPLKVLI